MIVMLALITGILVSILPGLFKLDKILSATNAFVGVVGALLGALLGFGDAGILLKYPILNEITLMFAVSILFVSVKILATRNRTD